MARNAVVHTEVHMGEPKGMEGFGLEINIRVEGVPDEALIQAGHEVCCDVDPSLSIKHETILLTTRDRPARTVAR